MQGRNNYYKLGSYNIICPRCGQKHKRDNCSTEWTGQLVCNNCYDPRHPVTMPLPVVIDGLPVPDARPRATSVNYVSYGGISTWDNIVAMSEGSIDAIFGENNLQITPSNYLSGVWGRESSTWTSNNLTYSTASSNSGSTINWENADINWENI